MDELLGYSLKMIASAEVLFLINRNEGVHESLSNERQVRIYNTLETRAETLSTLESIFFNGEHSRPEADICHCTIT